MLLAAAGVRLTPNAVTTHTLAGQDCCGTVYPGYFPGGDPASTAGAALIAPAWCKRLVRGPRDVARGLAKAREHSIAHAAEHGLRAIARALAEESQQVCGRSDRRVSVHVRVQMS